MKRINQQAYSLLLAVAVAITVPVYAADNQYDIAFGEETEANATPESVAWYKKESTQKIASAVVIAAVVAYAIAVRMNKVRSPFAWCAALCGAQAAKNSVAQVTEVGSEVKNNEQTPSTPVEDQKQPEVKESTQTDSFEKPVVFEANELTQQDEQPVNVSSESQVGLVAKNFAGQEIQVPQAIKNIWKAMTQPRSDSDLLHVH